MGYSYVIEHMEDDDETPTGKQIPPWVILEYTHMRSLTPQSSLKFTNLSKPSSSMLAQHFAAEKDAVECRTTGVIDLIKDQWGDQGMQRVCLLDPKAQVELKPEDGDAFEWFLFGGILGDDPPRDRTSELRVLGFPSRHLGPVQMTTDTAVGVTKTVIEDKIPLDRIPYIDNPTIKFSAKESVEMPFRYIAKDNEPLLPVGMRELLREDLNKSFVF